MCWSVHFSQDFPFQISNTLSLYHWQSLVILPTAKNLETVFSIVEKFPSFFTSQWNMHLDFAFSYLIVVFPFHEHPEEQPANNITAY